MKYVISIFIFMFTQSSAASDVQSLVNYHLKSTETKIEKNASQSRLEAIKVRDDEFAPSHTDYNDPHYGLGAESTALDPQQEPVSQDLPQVLNPREKIEYEASLKSNRSVSNNSESEDFDRRQFIEEFKRNAARKGIRVEVNPETLEVREVH